MARSGFLKRKYPVGMSLPRCSATAPFGPRYTRYWGRSEASRAGDRQHQAYVEAMGREAPRFDTGLAKAQWEYAIQGTAYFSKAAREGVVALSAAK